MRNQKGQSLIEIIVGLAVGSVLIGAAVVGIVFVLRTGSVNETSQTAASLARDLLLRARSLADARWLSVYSLEKGPDFLYYVAASGTELAIVSGIEGIATDVPTNGLLAHWGFDESSGMIIHDSLPNGTRGEIVGETAYSASCRIGGCRVFSGLGDFVFFGNNSALDLQENLTLSLWMRPSSIPSSENTGLLSKGALRYGLTYHNDGHVRFYIGSETNNVHAGASPGVWHHVAGVFDIAGSSPTLRLYLDGTEVATTTSSFAATGAEGDLFVGAYGSNYFSGEIDDVRVYDRALSSDEVYALYNGAAFTRSFTLQNVYRNPSGNITTQGVEDPSTQEITLRVGWTPAGSSQGNFELKDYLTRWRNEVFHQTDWSSGPESLTPLPEPGGGYSNSTNIRFAPGEIRLNEL